MSAEAAKPSRPIESPGSGGGVTVRLESLRPFLADVERFIPIGELQAAFGMDRRMTRKAVRILVYAQLLDERRSSLPLRTEYTLAGATVKLLTPFKIYRLSRTKALEYINLALDAATNHNAACENSRVTALLVKGTLLDSNAQTYQFVEVEATVAVKPVGVLVQDIAKLMRAFRTIGDRSVRASLVLNSA
jgi:hypothetical protein